ncbi:6867_t:CDS:2 [Diversispora eburnea]|uniref:6867_t:CDS:1 n=1 Tax=Diversispora eburnea TaxID=1213867 RepID=A0A9N8V750_9GLOM|nr:6867_t:CDS:2 [Diversispora eburnea]
MRYADLAFLYIYTSWNTLILSDSQHESVTDQSPLLDDESEEIEIEDEGDMQHGHASYSSCAINLSNTILGTGIMMIFYAAATSGLGLYFLSRAATHTKGRNASFFAISKLTYPKAATFFDLAIAIKCFGVSISYLIIIGQLMPQVIESIFGSEQNTIFLDRRFWITLSMIIIVPLSFLKRLDSLRHTSLIALFAVIYLMFIVIYNFLGPDYKAPPKDKLHLFNFTKKFLINLPIFVFSFTCHQNIFSVHNELEDNSQGNINGVIVGSIGTTSIIYQIIGILGYLSFGDDVSANIIAMFTIGRAAIVILVLFSYALQSHPARACLDKVISSRSHTVISHEFSQTKYILLTSGILISSYIIGMLVSELDLVLSFVGATGSTTVSFILPGLFYYKLHENSQWDIRKILSIFLVIYGFSVMFICLSLNILRVLTRG